MWLQNAFKTEHSTVLTVCTSNVGCGMCQVSPGRWRREREQARSLAASWQPLPAFSLPRRAGLSYLLSFFPSRSVALPRLPVPPSPPGEAADGQSWRRQLLPRGCLGRAAAVLVGKHGGGGGCQGRGRGMRRQMAACTGSIASVGNSVWEVAQIGMLPPKKTSPGRITPAGTYTMITISFPVPLCQYGVATQPATSRRAVSLLSTLWFWFRIFLDEALLFDYSGSTWGICNSNNLW